MKILNMSGEYMLQELDSYDWQEAFGYAGESGTNGSANVTSVLSNALVEGFTREDVEEIYGIIEGENDASPWRIYGKLNDDRYFYLEAGCDYTGWDCQADGHAVVAPTREDIETYGLTLEARRVFGLAEDIVGSIPVREPRENRVENGFTKITRSKKEKKVKKEEIVVIEKKKPANSILSLEILNEE